MTFEQKEQVYDLVNGILENYLDGGYDSFEELENEEMVELFRVCIDAAMEAVEKVREE